MLEDRRQTRYSYEPRGPHDKYGKSRWTRLRFPQRSRRAPIHMKKGNRMENYLTTLGIALTLALPHAAQAQGVTPPHVPTDIEVDAPNEAFLLGRGIGTQNYECQPLASLGRVDWVLFTPQATLFGDGDEQLRSEEHTSEL